MKNQQSLVKEIKGMESRKKDFRNNSLNKLIISRLKEGDILDIGCGSGYLLYYAQKNNIKVTGLEPNRELVKIAKKNYGNLNIINKPAEELGTIDQKFDNITMIDVLEHIDDDNKVVKKVYNLLKNKGRFIINVPTIKFLFVERAKEMGDKRRYSKKEIISMLTNNKFSINEIRYWNFLGFWSILIIEKIFNKRLESNMCGLRSDNPNGIKKYINRLLSFWFDKIENNFNFGLGASLFCVAEKVK